MKKLLAVLVLSLICVGCGSSDSPTTNTATKGFIFEANETKIQMNADASEIVKSLGKETSYFEAASCAFDGLDKTYTYSGFQLKTYPKDDKDYVNSIVVKDDSVSTPEGISIGDAKSKVVEKYGDKFEDKSGAYLYTQGDSTLEFLFENDAVTSIIYTAIVK